MGPSSVVRRVYSSAFSVRLPEIVNEPLVGPVGCFDELGRWVEAF